MILYFSATGNSRYAAERISGDEEWISLGELLKNGQFSLSPAPGERLVLIVPVYYWGIPAAVETFLRQVKLTADGKNRYVAAILTCGGSTGNAGKVLARAMEKAGIAPDALFSAVMPDNFAPGYPLADRQEAIAILNRAETEFSYIREQLEKKARGDFDFHKGNCPALQTAILHPLYHLSRRTALFHSTDSCIGCGLCQAVCPENAVKLGNGRPVWVKSKCSQCLACLNRCPAHAIAFGPVSLKHGQYVNPYVKW